jgi:hypothetical protein
MIWLLWLAFTAAILTAWLLLSFIAVTVIHLSQQAARRRFYQALTERVIDEHPARVADAIIRATREDPHQTYAWGPGGQKPKTGPPPSTPIPPPPPRGTR